MNSPILFLKCRIHKVLALILIGVIPVSALADTYSLPQLGSRENAILTPREEHRIGREVYQRIQRSNAIFRDPEINAYIQRLGEKLLHSQIPDEAGMEMLFFLIRSADVNAFALPGGYVGVHTALIDQADSESELAGVLAHEIIHVTQRHFIHRINMGRNQNIATLIGVIAALVLSGGNPEIASAAISAGMAVSTENFIHYTYLNELEADRMGMELMAQAGFSPDAVADFFEKIQRIAQLHHHEFSDFLRDHPVNSQRIAEARNRAAQQKLSRASAADNNEFSFIKTRLDVLLMSPMQLQRAITQLAINKHQPLSLYRAGLLFLRSGQSSRAESYLRTLVQNSADCLYCMAALARTLEKDHVAESLKIYENILYLFPHRTEYRLQYAESLLHAGDYYEAKSQLNQLDDDGLFSLQKTWLLARCAEGMGQQAGMHEYLARYYLQLGYKGRAIDHLNTALTFEDITTWHKQRLRARLTQLGVEGDTTKRKNSLAGENTSEVP